MTVAGDLRTIVAFQSVAELSDGYGGHTRAWTTQVTTHCQFRAQSGRETLETGRIEASATATLRCRTPSVSSVDESWRAMIDGTAWNIRSVIPFGQKGQWTDMVIERAGKGVAV